MPPISSEAPLRTPSALSALPALRPSVRAQRAASHPLQKMVSRHVLTMP